MARPTKLTRKVIDAIGDAVARGLPRKHAAALAGVSATAMFEWLARGRELIESGETDLTADERLQAEFAERLEKSDSEFVGHLVGLVQEAAESPRNWTAAAWLLERRHHKEFGRRQAVELGGLPDSPPIKIETKELDKTQAEITAEIEAKLDDLVRDRLRELSVDEFTELVFDLKCALGSTPLIERGFSEAFICRDRPRRPQASPPPAGTQAEDGGEQAGDAA